MSEAYPVASRRVVRAEAVSPASRAKAEGRLPPAEAGGYLLFGPLGAGRTAPAWEVSAKLQGLQCGPSRRRGYLGLGSNVGDKRGYLRTALGLLEPECRVQAASSFYRTEPVGYREQDWFLNCAARVETERSPHELLEFIQGIENQLGRVRAIPNGPRTIDIDILLFDNLVIDSGGLTVPHPRMHERGFVLQPLAEIAAEVVHPVLGMTIGELLSKLPATHRVEIAAND